MALFKQKGIWCLTEQIWGKTNPKVNFNKKSLHTNKLEKLNPQSSGNVNTLENYTGK